MEESNDHGIERKGWLSKIYQKGNWNYLRANTQVEEEEESPRKLPGPLIKKGKMGAKGAEWRW